LEASEPLPTASVEKLQNSVLNVVKTSASQGVLVSVLKLYPEFITGSCLLAGRTAGATVAFAEAFYQGISIRNEAAIPAVPELSGAIVKIRGCLVQFIHSFFGNVCGLLAEIYDDSAGWLLSVRGPANKDSQHAN
jgi:hypothetical protein